MNKVFKALSDPTRRRVLQLLRERPMSAGELSDHFAVSKPTMSAHFAVLQEAGLIEAEKSGRTIVYRLVMSVLEEALLGFAQTFGWGLDSKRRLASTPRWRSGSSKEKSDMALNWISPGRASALPLIGIGLALANWNAKPAAALAWAAPIVIFVVMVAVQRRSQLAFEPIDGRCRVGSSVASVADAVVFAALMMIIPLALTLARSRMASWTIQTADRRSTMSHHRRVPRDARQCHAQDAPADVVDAVRRRTATGVSAACWLDVGALRSWIRDGVARAADRRGGPISMALVVTAMIVTIVQLLRLRKPRPSRSAPELTTQPL